MVEVRQAGSDDEAVIRAIHLDAFPGNAEADLVEALVAEGDVLASLIAEHDGVAAGHVLCSRMQVEADGVRVHAAGIGPVGVRPDMQRRGIGAALMTAAVQAMRNQHVRIVFLLGEPGYYRRFGFEARTAAPFASPYAGPHFMAMPLDEKLELPLRGRAEYAPAFGRLES